MSILFSLDAEKLYQTLLSQLRTKVKELNRCTLIGIHSGGAWIAQRLAQDLELTDRLGFIDVSFHRDDYNIKGLRATVRSTRIYIDIEGATVILVDDVLYTGRTTRAAINELFDYGRPERIMLATLVDREGRQLPIAADFIGSTVDLAKNQTIELTQSHDGLLTLSVHHV